MNNVIFLVSSFLKQNDDVFFSVTAPNTCDPPAVSAGVALGSTSTEFSIGEQLSFSCASAQHHMDGNTTLICQNVEGQAKGVWSTAPPTCGKIVFLLCADNIGMVFKISVISQ